MASGNNPAEDIRQEPYPVAGEATAAAGDRLGEVAARDEAAEGWHAQVRRRTEELVASGAYPNRTQAWQAADQQVTDRQRRALEDQVVAVADRLDPADTSPGARLLRQTATSIGEHRADALWRQWPRPEAVSGQARPAPASGSPARLAATSFATPASGALGAAAAAVSADGRPAAQSAAAEIAAANARATGQTSRRRSR